MNYELIERRAQSWSPASKKLVFRFLLRPIRKVLYFSVHFIHTSVIPIGDTYRRFCEFMESFDVDNVLSTSGAGGSGSVQTRYLETTKYQWQFFKDKPKISILVPVYKVETRYLEEALASVALQTYPNWEVCIVDDASGRPEIDSVIKKFSNRFPDRVKYSVNPINMHISHTSNECLNKATGEWCALLDHDDRLYPNALFEMVRFINLEPDADVFFSDEVVIREDGAILGKPFFKPGWSPLLNLQVNYCAHLCVYRTSHIKGIGGFRVGYEGSQDHDLIMRAADASQRDPVHVPYCLYQWRVHPQSTASSIAAKPYAAENGLKAVIETCGRRNLPPVRGSYNSKTFHYDLSFAILGDPKVSIVIPTRNQLGLLRQCVESILSKSSWKNFEIIIVDNGSTDTDCLDWLKSVTSLGKVSVLRDDRDFNFAALNNLGVRCAKGDFVVLLNNDTEVLTSDWMEQMLQYAQMIGVGCVGARLLYEDGTIQHAGGILTGEKMANHACKKLPESDRRYMDAIVTPRECSFVTGACLMIAKSKYLDAGGLEESFVPNGYGDVELCLRLSATQGLKHVYAANAVLKHFESKSRGKSVETFERYYMLSRWSNKLNLDPYLNMNLERDEFFENDRHWVTSMPRDRHFFEMVSHEVKQIFMSES